MIPESGAEYKSDYRIKDMKNIFEKLFKTKDLGINSKFDRSVWFLSNDSGLQKIASECGTGGSKLDNSYIESIMHNPILGLLHSILTKQNDYDSVNISKLADFHISVADFINGICELLLKSQSVIESCQENISHYSALEKIEAISKKIQDIEDFNILFKSKEEKSRIASCLNFGLSRLDYLPEGDYTFHIVIKEVDSQFNVIRYEKPLASGKKIKILNSEERLKLFEMDLDRKDINFQEIYLSELDQEKFKDHIDSTGKLYLKAIQHKSIIDNNNEKSKTKAGLSFSNKIEEDGRCEQDKDFPLTKKRPHKSSNVDLSIISQKVEMIPFEFDFNENSGTNILSFGVSIERNGEKFGESCESFLDFLILHTDELLEINKEFFHSYYVSTIQTSVEVQSKNNLSSNLFNIVLSVGTSTSQSLKKQILRRIHTIFNANITLKKHHEEIINFVLETYFFEIKDRVNAILQTQENKGSSGACCGSCTIF